MVCVIDLQILWGAKVQKFTHENLFSPVVNKFYGLVNYGVREERKLQAQKILLSTLGFELHNLRYT